MPDDILNLEHLASACSALANDAEADAAFYRLLVENSADLIVRSNRERRRTYVSPASRDVLGFEPAELLGGNGFVLVHPDDQPQVTACLEMLGAETPVAKLTFRMRRRDAGYVWIEGRYRYLPEDGGILSILRDITARKQAEDLLVEVNARLEAANLLLYHLAHQDGLTGLANRRCFDTRLDEEFRRARRLELPLGLIMVDVDHFKAYNDQYGHIAGDECLVRVSQAVAGALKRPGDQAARYGGEEIAVLLPSTDITGAAAVGELIRGAVAALAIAHERAPSGIVTVSAGASAILPAGRDVVPADLVGTADRALYRAKAEGRNRVCRGILEAPAPLDPVSGESVAARDACAVH